MLSCVIIGNGEGMVIVRKFKVKTDYVHSYIINQPIAVIEATDNPDFSPVFIYKLQDISLVYLIPAFVKMSGEPASESFPKHTFYP